MSESPRPAPAATPGRKPLIRLWLGACLLAAAAAPPTAPAAPAPPTAPAAPAAPVTAAAPTAPVDIAGLDKARGAAALEPARAVAVQHLTLSGGLARMELDHGVLIPAAALGGRTLEMVFVGTARVALDPPDDIEAGQLDWFTGRANLDEEISAAVLVLGMNNAAAALLRRPAATPTAEQLATATELFSAWKKRERRAMGIEAPILGLAAGDPSLTGYFAALCRNARLGDFLYIFDPQSEEQEGLGRFVPIDPTAKQRKEEQKALAREQRQGHMVGVDLDELGTWDTWVSAANRSSQGAPQPGAAAFESRSYDLDLRLADRDLRLTGRARLELVPILAGARTVRLRLQRDLAVSRVGLDTAPGPPSSLAFHRDGNDLTVVLPRAFEQGETVGLTVEYAGPMIDDYDGTYVLRDTLGWYPHAGEIDRARYTATFHWPGRLKLLASGRRLAGGDDPGGGHWEKRAQDQATFGMSFEIGNFRVETFQAGHVRITVGFSPLSARLETARSEVLQTVRDTLTYYESIFGPYPLDELAVATAPQWFSQGLPGLVTLSDLMLVLDTDFEARLYGLPDRRAYVAHEVAHQWWGDSVSWAGYRDQWISEALASYCALRFAADKKQGNVIAGREPRWQRTLSAAIGDGRTVESIGPVVLGRRLSSSRSQAAYQAIVYDKGSAVLKTLEATLGADQFLHALGQIARQNAGRTLSTWDLMDQVGTLTGTDLKPFAEQFIYGTGMRTVFYSYSFEPQAGGAYRVIGQARQETPRQYRYHVVKTAAGGFDVQREAIAGRSAAEVPLKVPAEIQFVDPAAQARKGANLTVLGRLQVRGASSEFAIDVKGKPTAFSLDPRGEVFARFYDEQRHPRRSQLMAAKIAAGQDRFAEADALLVKALAIDDKDEADPWVRATTVGGSTGFHRTVVEMDHKATQRQLTVEIQLTRARLFLQQGRDAEARTALDAVGGSDAAGAHLGDERDLLLSWLDIHRGLFDNAFRRLRDSHVDTAESTLLLAIAARAAGHHDEAAAALKAARRKGADAALLEAGREPAR